MKGTTIMKKLFALLMTLAIVLSLAACGGDDAATTDDTGDTGDDAQTQDTGDDASTEKEEGWWKEELTTVTDGKLTVATSPDFAPYEFYAIAEDGTPTLAGFDVALAGYVADYLGLELEMVTLDFDGVLMEVGNGNADLAMAGLSPDPDRANLMDFSDIYYTGGQSLVCLKENADKFDSFEKCNQPDVVIGAQTGSIQVGLAEDNTPDANNIQLAKVTDIIAEILSGKMDLGYIETEVALSYQKNYPDLEIVLEVPYENAGSSIGVTKGNEALMAGVNEAIAAALEDGSMNDFVAQAQEQAAGTTGSLVDGEIVVDEE